MATHKYVNHSQKYIIKTFDYQKQFCHLYAHRLAEMHVLMQQRSIDHWGSSVPIKKLCDLREDDEEECIIIGTIYKQQAHKPSILKEISEENQLAPQPPRQNYSDPEDKIILEDELQRVRLYGKVRTEDLATGVICAAMGVIEEDGRFVVQELIFYESGIQKPLAKQGNGSRLLVLVSGLDWVESHNFVDSLNLFQYWLRGNFQTSNKSLKIRLIVAGNSVKSCEEKRSSSLQNKNSDSKDIIDAVKALDDWFYSWSSFLAVDVMPGPYDPANYMLPQQPFHRCMFPKAAKHDQFQSVSNPYACSIDDALVVGTSGQNVNDLIRCTTLEKPLDSLRSTLKWGHLAPTAPDTLSCYPYIDTDPFILKVCPHVYFAGNCSEFASEIHEGSNGQKTRIVCVPRFDKTQSIAVVDLESLDCYEVSFNCSEDE